MRIQTMKHQKVRQLLRDILPKVFELCWCAVPVEKKATYRIRYCASPVSRSTERLQKKNANSLHRFDPVS
jgi:hypothetical protein